MILWTLVAIALYGSLAAVFKRANIVWLHWNVYLCKVLLWFNFKTEKKKIDKKKRKLWLLSYVLLFLFGFCFFFWNGDQCLQQKKKKKKALAPPRITSVLSVGCRVHVEKAFFFWCHLSRRCDDRRFWLSGGAVVLQSDERMRPFVLPAKSTLAFIWSAKHFFLWMLQNKHEEKWITGKQNWQTKKGGKKNKK